MFKVKKNTNPNKLAGAIAGTVREGNEVEIQCIGAAAVNQAVKAIIITIGFLAKTGEHIQLKPSFTEVEIEGEKMTGIKFEIERKEETCD